MHAHFMQHWGRFFINNTRPPPDEMTTAFRHKRLTEEQQDLISTRYLQLMYPQVVDNYAAMSADTP